MQRQFGPVGMAVKIQVINPAGVKGRGAANDAVHLVALGEQQLGEVRTILASDAGDQCFFHE